MDPIPKDGIKTILIGPGSLPESHIANESLRWEEVVLTGELYYELILAMFTE